MKNITRFLTAQTISLFGSSLVQYSIVWHITLNTSSGTMLTLSTLCGFLPQILISLFAGTWADRYSRKHMIMLSDCVIAASTLLLALSFFAEQNNLWLLFLVLAIRSAGTGIQTPAVQAVIPQLTEPAQLMKINGISSTLNSITMFLSPAISGAILSIASIEATLLIDVITAVIGVGMTAAIPIPAHPVETGKNSCVQEIRDGFSYLKKNPFLGRILIFQILILFLISPSAFLTPLLVNRFFGADVWRLTASEMTYSLGMILGGILITTWGGFPKQLHTTLLAGGLYGFIMIGLGSAPVFFLYLVFNTLIGITSPCYNAPITVTIQKTTDSSMLGRIFSMMQISTSCALPLGMMVFGPLSDVFSLRWILILAGICVCLTVFLAGWFRFLEPEQSR